MLEAVFGRRHLLIITNSSSADCLLKDVGSQRIVSKLQDGELCIALHCSLRNVRS